MSTLTATVLIVDDELFNRKLLEALLRPEGYVTVSAASGEEALACVAKQAPDLILLDIMMPGMDGYQVARTLKANPATSNIPIIMVTAHSDRHSRLTGLEAGAEDFLTKPVDRAELWLRARNLLRLKSFSDFLQQHSGLLEQQVKMQVQARTADLQRFRSAMDATADAIFLVSRVGMRYVEVNTTACSMLGYTREELLEMGPAQITSISTAGTRRHIHDSLIANPGGHEMAERLLRQKGWLASTRGNSQEGTTLR